MSWLAIPQGSAQEIGHTRLDRMESSTASACVGLKMPTQTEKQTG